MYAEILFLDTSNGTVILFRSHGRCIIADNHRPLGSQLRQANKLRLNLIREPGEPFVEIDYVGGGGCGPLRPPRRTRHIDPLLRSGSDGVVSRIREELRCTFTSGSG